MPDELPRLGEGCRVAGFAGLPAGSLRRGCRPHFLQHLLDSRQSRAEGLPSPGRVQASAEAGKEVCRIGCVAQQEGEHIFERAPHVSLVAGSSSYRNLPQMLVQLERGERPPDWTTATRKRPSKRNSLPVPTCIAATSPLSRAATNSAPTAWCLTRADASAAAPRSLCWKRRGALSIAASRRFNCLG